MAHLRTTVSPVGGLAMHNETSPQELYCPCGHAIVDHEPHSPDSEWPAECVDGCDCSGTRYLIVIDPSWLNNSRLTEAVDHPAG